MSSASRPASIPARAALAALVALGSACPAGFVDPNPPVLQRQRILWSPPVEDEPIVYALLLDLHLARGLDCAGTKAQLVSMARTVFVPFGVSGVELPVVDISPGCRQELDRHFDPNALDTSIRQAEALFAGWKVRPILLYVNNVDLAVQPSLQSDFAGLRILAAQRGAPLPVTWAIALGRGKDANLFERLVGWTYAIDQRMVTELGGVVGRELPLRGTVQPPANGVPLLADPHPPPLQLKGCGPVDSRVTPVGFAFDGRAQAFDPANPPRFIYNAPLSPPVMKSAFTARPVEFWVETCSALCGHFTRLQDGSLVPWDRTPGCLLPAGSGT